jgi:hypothetical protein
VYFVCVPGIGWGEYHVRLSEVITDPYSGTYVRRFPGFDHSFVNASVFLKTMAGFRLGWIELCISLESGLTIGSERPAGIDVKRYILGTGYVGRNQEFMLDLNPSLLILTRFGKGSKVQN